MCLFSFYLSVLSKFFDNCIACFVIKKRERERGEWFFVKINRQSGNGGKRGREKRLKVRERERDRERERERERVGERVSERYDICIQVTSYSFCIL